MEGNKNKNSPPTPKHFLSQGHRLPPWFLPFCPPLGGPQSRPPRLVTFFCVFLPQVPFSQDTTSLKEVTTLGVCPVKHLLWGSPGPLTSHFVLEVAAGDPFRSGSRCGSPLPKVPAHGSDLNLAPAPPGWPEGRLSTHLHPSITRAELMTWGEIGRGGPYGANPKPSVSPPGLWPG